LKIQRHKKVGLALGGGVVRGLAHVGVITVLEEAGIELDYLAGTSAGSIIAVLYSAGMNASKIREFTLRFHWWQVARPVWPVRGLVSFDRLARWMEKNIGDLDFSDLHIPCSVIATDIETGERVTINSGRVIPAIQASCSLPGLVAPVELDGRLLCDGGITDMLPVSALREMGADYTIGVDILTFKLRRYFGPLGYLFAGLEIVLENAGGGTEYADCLIAPQLQGETYINFYKRKKLFELGRDAALKKLDYILSDLGKEPLALPMEKISEGSL
jgi:NTE family protein